MRSAGQSTKLLIAVTASLGLVVSACSSSSNLANETPLAGGTLVDLQNFAAGDPDHLDPALASDIQSQQIASLVFDGLTEVGTDGATRNAVAEEVTSSDGGKTWTFRLRDDVEFTNGDTVEPSDFKFAWERVLDPALGSRLASQFDVIEGASNASTSGTLSGVSADDEANVLVVHLVNPYQDFPSQVANPVFSPLPRRMFQLDPSLDTTFDSTAMVGNGPFKMESPWERGKGVVLIRNDGYYGGPDDRLAYLNKIDFRVSKDVATAYTDFQSGNVDLGRIPPAQYEAATTQYGSNAIDTPLMGTEYWGFNLGNATVGGPENQKLRLAIAAAIDKADIVSKIYNGSRITATGWAPPSTPGYEPNDEPDHDIEQAKQLLQQWGKTPPQIKVSFNAGAGHEEKAAIIVANLDAVGIPAVVDPIAQENYGQAIRSGALQFFRGSWNADFASYDNFIYPLFDSESIGGDNVFAYRSDRVDSLVREARTKQDSAQREALYRQAESQVLQDQVVVPIDWTSASLVKSDRVQEVHVFPLGTIAYDRVWLKD